MVEIDSLELQGQLMQGFYHKIIDLGSHAFDRPNILFLVVEAYLELGEVDKAEVMLDTINKADITHKEEILQYYYRAKCQFLKNDYPSSLEDLEQGLTLVKQTKKESLLEARVLTAKGEVYWRQGKLEQAKNLVTTAIELFMAEYDAYYLAIALNSLGMILRGQGRIEEALEAHQQSLKLREELGNNQHIANSLNNIAVVYWTNGKLKTALQYLERALSLKDKIENTKNIANWITNIAVIKDTQGFLYVALQMYSEALVLFEKSNNLPSIATLYANIGGVYRNLGLLFEAKSKFERALKLRMQVGNPHYIAESIFFVTLIKFDMKIPINIVEIQNLFPKPPYEQHTIQAYYLMIQGLLAKQIGLLSDALHYWQEAVNMGLLEFYFQTFCYEQLTLVLFQQWMNTPTQQFENKFKEKLKSWELLSKENNLISSLCKIRLINAKLEIAESHYDSAEMLLNQCLSCAQENDLESYLKLTQREIAILKKMTHKLTTSNGTTSKSLEKVQFEEIPLYISNINKMLEQVNGLNSNIFKY